MGYGIHVKGSAPKTGFLGLGRDNRKALRGIAEAFSAEMTDPLHRRFLRTSEGPGILYVSLHPAAEDIEISIDGGLVLVSTKTSTAGPGYHAMLVDLIDAVAERAGMKLDWRGKDGKGGDETGYREHRDVGKLRRETLRWLKTISRHLLDSAGEGAARFQINMPVDGDMVARDFFAMAPMGEFSRDWFETAANADETRLSRMAERFFPGWHGPDRGEYWASIGQYMMLWHVDWTAPDSNGQRQIYQDAIACFDRARQLDAALDFPETELAELTRLLDSEDTANPPAEEGAGFRRGDMIRQFGGAWSGRIPGYFRFGEDVHEDGRHRYYWFGDREVHFSTLSFRSDDDSMTARTIAGSSGEENVGRVTFAIRPAHEWLDASAACWQSETHGTVQSTFGVSKGNRHEVLVLTLIHEDDSDGATWARSVLESVSCPKPSND